MVRDAFDMRRVIEGLGARVEDVGERSWRITARDLQVSNLDPDLCRRIRTSILVAGPVVAREGSLRLPPPGGDIIGRRRLDTHILALRALGAEVTYERAFQFRTSGLVGADVLLDEASVTGTENAIMAAVLAKGETVLHNAASEPHVQELCLFLNALGAKIEGAGSNTLVIHGVEGLHGGEGLATALQHGQDGLADGGVVIELNCPCGFGYVANTDGLEAPIREKLPCGAKDSFLGFGCRALCG